MIMMNPNKDRVTTIVASIQKDKNGNPSGREELKEERGTVTDAMAAKEAAMDSFLVAVDKKDSRGMVRAMKTFLELCEYEGDGEEEKGENSGHTGNPYDYDKRDKNPYYGG
jgi:hypothetical protein